MKTIEEIVNDAFESCFDWSLVPHRNFKQKEIEQDIKQAIQIGMIEWEQQQVSIAVENALQSCDKFLSVYTTVDYNLTSLLPQILEELKGGEGYD